MLKRNQIMITALAIMIAVAGYLNFAGTKAGEEQLTSADAGNAGEDMTALLDLSEEDVVSDIDSMDSDQDGVAAADYLNEQMPANAQVQADSAQVAVVSETMDEASAEQVAEDTDVQNGEVPGEAVFTSSTGVTSLAGAKLQKEQTRAKNKETLLDIINNANISEEQKQDAINGMIALTDMAEKETAAAIKWVAEKLVLNTRKSFEAETVFKSQLYDMLEKYTKTPTEIINLMDAKKTEIDGVVETVMHQICNLRAAYREDVKSNVLNMVEKYFSISYPNKQIFIKDREAYPLKLNATDEEDSKVEQTAALEEPLQSKAIFFDNKKMLQKSRACDGVTFMFARLNTMYCSRQFKVKIVVNKDYCMLKFTEYTMEEDIIHVLFSLIGTTGLAE